MNDKFNTVSIMEKPRINRLPEGAQRLRKQVIPMEGVGLWGQFVDKARAGDIDSANTGTFPRLGPQDVQDGLKRATETYISLASKRPIQESASSVASNSLVHPSDSKDPPTNKPAAPPPTNLIEFTSGNLIDFD
jgi:hypothetical protein